MGKQTVEREAAMAAAIEVALTMSASKAGTPAEAAVRVAAGSAVALPKVIRVGVELAASTGVATPWCNDARPSMPGSLPEPAFIWSAVEGFHSAIQHLLENPSIGKVVKRVPRIRGGTSILQDTFKVKVGKLHAQAHHTARLGRGQSHGPACGFILLRREGTRLRHERHGLVHRGGVE